MKQGRSFDAVAEDYLRARSAYPAAMIEHVIDAAALSPESKILDIGCGSGQATMDFVSRDYHVVGIDPAARAIELLAERCKNYPNVELVQSTLEDFSTAENFDLIVCAQAFHWLDAETASSRISKLLHPGGHVALFWHLQDVVPDSPQGDLYRMASQYFPSFPVMNPPEYAREFLDAMLEILCRDNTIHDGLITEYPHTQQYEKPMFASLLRSSSMYSRLDPSAKEAFNAELDAWLMDLHEDPVIDYRTCLIEAVKRGS